VLLAPQRGNSEHPPDLRGHQFTNLLFQFLQRLL
jgi:hypothetical protein